MPIVTIYSRRNCHLCEVAEATVRTLLSEVDFELDVIYIDGNEVLEAKYGEEVPVTFIDGNRHDFYRVNGERLKNALLHQHQ